MIWSLFPIAKKLFSPLSGRVDAGLGDAPSGYGSEYDQLFQNNPYYNDTYNKTWLQTMLGAMGFRTGYDTWREQTENNAYEENQRIFGLMQQNDFNDPTSQAARMRAAGINSDLLGTGDVAGAASSEPDVNGQQINPNDVDAITQNVSSVLLNVIPSALSFCTNLTQLRGLQIDNDAKELAFSNSALDSASRFFSEGITEQDYRDAFSSGNWDNILKASQKDSDYLTNTLLSSKSARKRFKLAYGLHSNSLLAQIQKYKSYDEFEAARKSLFTKRGSPFFSEDDASMESLMTAFLGPIERFQQKSAEISERYAKRALALGLPEANANLESIQVANQQEYEEAIDPTAQANAENSANDYQLQQNELMEATNTLFSEIMNSLKEHDNWWSKIAMALVGIARSQLLSGMHFQFGRTTGFTPKGAMDLSTFGVSQ